MTRTKSSPQAPIPSMPPDPASILKAHSEGKTHIVHGGHGHAFEVKKGTSFRIIDLHGRQIVDMMAWVLPYPDSMEHLSMSYTRYVLGGTAPPAVGECLVTNKQRPLLRLTHDTVHTHDLTFMACNPAFYHALGLPHHRSCAQNIAEAMRPWGMTSYLQATQVDPFNVFQNTPDYSLKDLGCSRAGDFVEFEVLGGDGGEGEEGKEREGEGVVVGVSSCPYDVDGFGGGKATDIAIVTGLTPRKA